MYNNIQQLKEQKFNKSQVSRQLNINIKTVIKYWDMPPEEFAQNQQDSLRFCKLDQYQKQILSRLQQYPDLSAAQIHDWLMEIYPAKCFRERTVRRYVARLREKFHIPKIINIRQYEAVDELPPGQQLQVDFGEISVPTAGGGRRRVYCMATVLAHSRYKYAEWSDQPFTTARLTTMLRRCFEYIGGMPLELVFDQDKLVAVSENHGDILYTEEFERFRQAMRFKVYLCRKSDPESKGKVEAVVKYVKNNFAKHRLFTSLQDWNRSQLDWLERTGNQKEHGTTKKVPAKVHVLEKPHLQPIPLIKLSEDIVTVAVRKDNTILYKSNRYSVPLGTYRPDRKVRIDIQEGRLIISDDETANLLAEHRVAQGKGLLIKSNSHRRDNTLVIDSLQEKTLSLLGNTPIAAQFITAIRKEKSRYARDQFQVLAEIVDKYPPATIQEAIGECLRLNLISAVSCRDIVSFLCQQKEASLSENQSKSEDQSNILPAGGIIPIIQAEHRHIDAYTQLYDGVRA